MRINHNPYILKIIPRLWGGLFLRFIAISLAHLVFWEFARPHTGWQGQLTVQFVLLKIVMTVLFFLLFQSLYKLYVLNKQLKLYAYEKILPCPLCGYELFVGQVDQESQAVNCPECGSCVNYAEALHAWRRVCRDF
jgi:hypothetical protein